MKWSPLIRLSLITLVLAAGQAAHAKCTLSQAIPTSKHVFNAVGEREWELTVYTAKKAGGDFERRPAIVFFNDSDWRAEGVGSLSKQAACLSERAGLVGITAERRLKTRDASGPVEGVEDAIAAMRWLRTHADELAIDKERIAAAGGHLALATAMFEGRFCSGNACATKTAPDALLLFNPVLDLAEKGEKVFNENLVGVSPIQNLRKPLPPTLIIQAKGDTVTPLSVAEEFVFAARRSGSTNIRLVEYPGRPQEILQGQSVEHDDLSDTLDESLEFLRAVGWGRSTTALPAGSINVVIKANAIDKVPYFKTKLGFARAVSLEKLPDTMKYFDLAKPRAFCSEVDFDDVEDKNFALLPDPFLTAEAVGRIPASDWLTRLLKELEKQKIDVYFQLIGAPKPFQPKVISRPAIHPTPTDITKSARLIGKWAETYLSINPSINWVVWNEPSHTLRGRPTAQAADDMASIFNSYIRELGALSPYDSFGLAGFIAHALKPVKGGGAMSFLERVFGRLGSELGPEVSAKVNFIAVNNYYGSDEDLLIAVNSLLSDWRSHAPIIFTQFAPEGVAEGKYIDNENLEARRYLTSLDRFSRDGSVKHVCMSFWAGGNKAFVKLGNGNAREQFRMKLFALAMYQKLPAWRVEVVPDKQIKDSLVFAGVDQNRLGILLVNDLEADRSYRIQVDDRKWHGIPIFVWRPAEGGMSQSLLGAIEGTGAIQIALKKGEMAFLEISRGRRGDMEGGIAPGTYMRSDTHIYRGSDSSYSKRSNIGHGVFDQVRNEFLMAVPEASAVAHGSVVLRNTKRNVALEWEVPPNQSKELVKECAFVAGRSLDSPKGNSFFIGKREAQKELVAKNGRLVFERALQQPLSWRAMPSGNWALDLDLGKLLGAEPSEVELHAGLINCGGPAQARVGFTYP